MMGFGGPGGLAFMPGLGIVRGLLAPTWKPAVNSWL